MPSKLIRFGDNALSYTFPELQTQLSDNFASAVPITTRMPGMSGGFDEYGITAAPQEVGKVQVTFTLLTRTMTNMVTLQDAVRSMREFGVQNLWLQTSDPNANLRWCRARVNDIQMSKPLEKAADVKQTVIIYFQVADPHWYSFGTESTLWGGGATWGSAAKWGGTVAPVACSGLATNFTLTTVGNAITKPRITAGWVVGQSTLNFTLQRLVNGLVMDEMIFPGVCALGDYLEINTRSLVVRKNGADAYSGGFSFKHPDWFRLYPGANSLRVVMGNSGDLCSVNIRYYEAYI